MLPHPALHASHAGIWLVGPDGVRAVGRGEAIRAVSDTPHLLLNAPLTGQRLGFAEISGLDLLELFAFIHPARFVVPTVAGFAGWCGLEAPADDAGAAALLIGLSDGVISVFYATTLAKILATLFVALVLVFRPQGLFGAKA